MRVWALQAVTWSMVAGAVSCAFWVASSEPGWEQWRNPFGGQASAPQTKPELASRSPPVEEGNERSTGGTQLVSNTAAEVVRPNR